MAMHNLIAKVRGIFLMFVLTPADVCVVIGLYILSCVGAGVLRHGLALLFGPN
jgi:hypothetical protein